MSNDYEDYLCVITREVASNCIFEYPDNNHIKVFYKNSFYTLSEAYYKYKILSDKDIRHIYDEFIK